MLVCPHCNVKAKFIIRFSMEMRLPVYDNGQFSETWDDLDEEKNSSFFADPEQMELYNSAEVVCQNCHKSSYALVGIYDNYKKTFLNYVDWEGGYAIRALYKTEKERNLARKKIKLLSQLGYTEE